MQLALFHEQHPFTAFTTAFTVTSTAPLVLRCGAGAARALEQQGASLLAVGHAACGQLAAHCIVPILMSVPCFPCVSPRRLLHHGLECRDSCPFGGPSGNRAQLGPNCKRSFKSAQQLSVCPRSNGHAAGQQKGSVLQHSGALL